MQYDWHHYKRRETDIDLGKPWKMDTEIRLVYQQAEEYQGLLAAAVK